MVASPLRARLGAGDAVHGAFCGTPSSFTTEVLADIGFDYVVIDCQHGLVGYEAMWPMVQAMRFAPTIVLVRVPANEAGWPERALDAGADGIVFPMVNSRADAEAAVRACRYAPWGDRSFGPVRAGMLVGRDPEVANRENLCIVMVETAEAVDRADEICATPGVDGVYVGPADLGVSLGLPADRWFVDDRHTGAIARVLAACGRAGIPAGIHTSGPAMAKGFEADGFRILTVFQDTTALRAGAAAALSAMRTTEPDG